MEVRFVDESEFGFGWIHPEPRFMQRTSHAILAGGGVWLIDPVEGDGVEERVRALGEPAGVVVLLDRHARDARTFAERLGTSLHMLPFAGLPRSPFELAGVRGHAFGREITLWCEECAALIVADSVGTAPYYCAGDEPLGVHPLLRLQPPRHLARFRPRHILCGHGEGLHGDSTADELREALDTARRRLPRWLAGRVYRLFKRGE